MNDSLELLKEIGKLQNDYDSLKQSKKLSKKAICDLVIPFRDKYRLSDKDALAIARNEMSIHKIAEILERMPK